MGPELGGAARPKSGWNTSANGRPSALVVPSRAAASATAPARGGIASAARSEGRTRGRSALTTRHTPSTPASAAHTAGPWPPPGSVTTSTPSSPATSMAAASSVTSRTWPPMAPAASSTSPSIASATSARSSAGRRLLPPERKGTTTVAIQRAYVGGRVRTTGQAAWLEAPGPEVAHSCTSNQCVPVRAAATWASV